MYWTKQEHIVFDIILFILVIFQLYSFFALNTDETNFQNAFILVGVNLILLAMMIPYAKWLLKTTSYQKAFLHVVKHELFILGLSATCIFLAILTIQRI